MAGNTKRLKWEKPKLMVIVRGNTEERVLHACKSEVSGNSAASDFNCYTSCGLQGCSAVAAS